MNSTSKAMFALAAASAFTGACGTNEPAYYPGSTILDVMEPGTEAKETLQVPFRTPTAAEEQARQKLSGEVGYEVPWLRADRVHVELRFTITNTDAKAGAFSLNIDGASEFARYDSDAVSAAFEAADMDAPAIHGVYQVLPPVNGQLEPGQVYQSAVREDDFREMALDLDALGRWMAPNFPAVLLYRSETDPMDKHGEYQTLPLDPTTGLPTPVTKFIRPALWEVTPRFNATRTMRCEFLVRVRDDDSRLWEDGQNQFMPAPPTYAPTIAPRM